MLVSRIGCEPFGDHARLGDRDDGQRFGDHALEVVLHGRVGPGTVPIVRVEDFRRNRMGQLKKAAGILVLRSFPRGTSVTELATAVLQAVALLDRLDISNRVYRLNPDGLEEEL